MGTQSHPFPCDGRALIIVLLTQFSLVTTMDFSAAETMTRVQRLLCNKGIHLILCGLRMESDVAYALRSVDLWTDTAAQIDVFASLNEALEWTESECYAKHSYTDEYLRSLYSSNLSAGQALSKASLSGSSALRMPETFRKPTIDFDRAWQGSPRFERLHRAAESAAQHYDTPALSTDDHSRLYSLIVSTLGPYAEDESEPVFRAMAPLLQELHLMKGTVLWDLGDKPDALFIIESGILKARYVFQQDNYELNEAMLAGTVAGEFTFLSQQTRNTTVTAEVDAKVWRIDVESLQRIAAEDVDVYARLNQILLRVAADEQNCIMSYLVSRLS